MGYDYDTDGDYGGRVLWGRVAFFGVTLLLAFALGRCTAAGGVPESELAAERERLTQLAEENERLEQQIAALQAGAGAAEQEPAGETAPATSTRTYIVRSGDTLISIAQEVYGDGSKFNRIAEANGIDENNKLRVGQELIIPPAD